MTSMASSIQPRPPAMSVLRSAAEMSRGHRKGEAARKEAKAGSEESPDAISSCRSRSVSAWPGQCFRRCAEPEEPAPTDRKSTRLNSSHLGISYAVFCLKKKKKRHKPAPEPYLLAAKRLGVNRALVLEHSVAVIASGRAAGFELLAVNFFFFNDTPTTEIYTLSLHDALPI